MSNPQTAQELYGTELNSALTEIFADTLKTFYSALDRLPLLMRIKIWFRWKGAVSKVWYCPPNPLQLYHLLLVDGVFRIKTKPQGNTTYIVMTFSPPSKEPMGVDIILYRTLKHSLESVIRRHFPEGGYTCFSSVDNRRGTMIDAFILEEK